ncbi:MAG: hypothetical protein AAF823_12550 [Planctomycetota bacterium]
MWQNLTKNVALRWDNADRVIAGVGLVACTIGAVLGGVGMMLLQRVAENPNTGPLEPSFSDWVVDHGFTLLTLGWVALLLVTVIYLARAPSEWGRSFLPWVYLAFCLLGIYFFGIGMHDMFMSGMRLVM